MLKIGDFSKIARISIRMLRHYDQIGLLKPYVIDEESGYRLYSVDQLPLINKIVFLKDIGFSLNEVKELINSNISTDEIKRMLIRRQRDLENEIALAQLNLNTITERLSAIEKEGNMPKYDVNIKSTEEFYVASIREIIPNIKDVGIYCYSMYSKLYKELKATDISSIGNEIVFYHNKEYSEKDLDMEAGVILGCSNKDAQKIVTKNLITRKIETAKQVAFLIYKGSYRDIEDAVVELLKAVSLKKWEIVGEVREIHLSGKAHEDEESHENAVVELQIPVVINGR